MLRKGKTGRKQDYRFTLCELLVHKDGALQEASAQLSDPTQTIRPIAERASLGLAQLSYEGVNTWAQKDARTHA